MPHVAVRRVSEFSEDGLKDFLTAVKNTKTKRRKSAQQRVDIEKESFSPLVEERIDTLYNDSDVKKQLKEYARLSLINPLKQITDRVATAYKSVPQRTLEDKDDALNTRFAQLLHEGRIGILAKQWLRWAFISNVVIVVPTIRQLTFGPTLRWEMVLPNTSEVLLEPNDPSLVNVLGYTMPDGGVCILDDQAWWYYDEDDNQIDVISHGLGVFPGTVFRLDEPCPDFWSSTRGNRLVFSTVEISRILCELNWVRKSQNRAVLHMVAEDLQKAIAEGQLMKAEGALEVQANPNAFKFDKLDLITSVDEFVKHVRLLYHEIAESYGIPSTLVDIESSASDYSNVTGLAQARQHATLADLREDQIQYLLYSEQELMWKTALMAQRFAHPLAVDPVVVRDSYKVTWPPLSFVDHPRAKLQVWKEKIALGIGFSQVDAVLELYPGMTRARALELIERAISERLRVVEFHRETNIPQDPEADVMSIAQLQGKLGGQATSVEQDEN